MLVSAVPRLLMLQQRLVALSPVLVLVAQVAAYRYFGVLGLTMVTPIVAVGLTLARQAAAGPE